MLDYKHAIVTGSAGFTGSILVKHLLNQNIEVYAIVRPGSPHNKRLNFDHSNLHVIELTPDKYDKLPIIIDQKCDIFFHLMWISDRSTELQALNVTYTINAINAAYSCGCHRFICTGSQAEYGIVAPNILMNEDLKLSPITTYGQAKVEACRKSHKIASSLNIDWIWTRIFSLIGENEPKGRMLPDLYLSLKERKAMALSSCRQNWDYLNVHDAADALIALAEHGRSGEIYNIAYGSYMPLIEYTERLKNIVYPSSVLTYGDDPNPYISLQPSIDKIKKDTGWSPIKSFEESVQDYIAMWG